MGRVRRGRQTAITQGKDMDRVGRVREEGETLEDGETRGGRMGRSESGKRAVWQG